MPVTGELNILDENFEIRESRKKDLSENERGLGRSFLIFSAKMLPMQNLVRDNIS